MSKQKNKSVVETLYRIVPASVPGAGYEVVAVTVIDDVVEKREVVSPGDVLMSTIQHLQTLIRKDLGL